MGDYPGYAEKAAFVLVSQNQRECAPVHTHAATAVHVHHHLQQPSCQVIQQQQCQVMSPAPSCQQTVASCQGQPQSKASSVMLPIKLAGPGAIRFEEGPGCEEGGHEHILLTDDQAKAIWQAQNGIISVDREESGRKRRIKKGRKNLEGRPESALMTEELRRRWRRSGTLHSAPTELTSSDEESCTIAAFKGKGKDAYKK